LRIFFYTSVRKRVYILLCLLLLLIGCSLQKKSNFNRHMQDLTAHYNILFNANQILQQKQDDYALNFIDSYNEILNVYQDTTTKTATLDKDLQSAVDKANKIIGIKEQSHYLGDAYLVLGKANFLGGQYFNANEYFNYVIKSFANQPKLVVQARVWKARTLLYLNKLPRAKLQLDTVMDSIPKKINPADIYATKLQYDIDVQDYADGENMAKQAIKYCKDKKQRLRWTFILAQIQELEQKNSDAYANYVKIAKSNAAFEMAFNADLNRIRIEDEQNGVKLSRIDKLKSLLKNPNNKEFEDQIYYQVAQLYFAGKDIDNAIKNYKLSVASSVKNQNQKGLSYLRIADINFNVKANYITAKKYYDSTLMTLTPNYPGYSLIQKKTNNLQLLTDRLLIISREDTLQMLAKMDEKTRDALIDTMVNQQILRQAAQANNTNRIRKSSANSVGNVINTGGNSTFYFYNSQAVSQGYNDFKRLWGDRKLEDDWRRSNRTSTQTANNIPGVNGTSDPTAVNDPTARSANAVTAGRYRQQIVQNLPLTPDLVAQSNQRIYNAYFDIANFYRDILDDKREAINAFETILHRFPDNPNLPVIYYSLYRLYTELNDPKAEDYKNRLLKNYPETAFAKIILDPDYSKKIGDQDAEFKNSYNQVFDLYDKKKYKDAVASADQVIKKYPGSKYLAQLYYLRAISAGHNEPVAAFKNDLEQIVKNYPNDKLIIPLITEHINYINANLVDMSARHNALLETDTTEVPFTPAVVNKKGTEFRYPGREMKFATVADVRKPEPKTVTTITPTKADSAKAVVANMPVANAPAKPVDPLLTNAAPVKKPVVSGIFSMRDSTNYYFVINVYKDNTNLAPSRFGIGQFNRSNLNDPNVKHLLKDVGNDNRLIFVGRFYSLASVKAYARAIIPLMPEIMTIPRDKYTFFIITSQNLDKLTSKKLLDNYIDFYQNNY